jgi:F0F1-type ATP synthase delta subunit
MIRYTRRQLATYAADALCDGDDVMPKIAAYLVASHRTKEADLLVRDIEKMLARRGTLVATATSAHELSESDRQQIEALLNTRYEADDIILKTKQDKTLLGGVVISTVGDEFDGSLKRSINRLKALGKQ